MNPVATNPARYYAEVVFLSAIWGSSFLFLRMAAPAFGPIFLAEMRIVSGLVVVLPLCLLLDRQREVRAHWRMIFIVSMANMTVPFSLFAYASLDIGAGLLSILNATVPFFTALVAFVFFQQRLSLLGMGGMLVGFLGVVVLVFNPAEAGIGGSLALPAALSGSLLYGISLNLVAHRLRGVSGLAITTGSLLMSSIVLLPFALRYRPETMPGAGEWLAVLMLGVVCTGFGFVLFYRLIDRIGSEQAVTTVYLVPLFSILWGRVFLAESITLYMVLGSLLVLLGVGMTTGTLFRRVIPHRFRQFSPANTRIRTDRQDHHN